MTYLHKFPFDALKIDRSFISRMGNEGESSQIVKTMINLGARLGIYLVAEGVETSEQPQRIKDIDSHRRQGQGYYFSRPLNSTAVQAFKLNEPE